MLNYKVRLLYPSYGAEVRNYNDLRNAVNYAVEIANNYKSEFVNISLVNPMGDYIKLIGIAHYNEEIKQVCIVPSFEDMGD